MSDKEYDLLVSIYEGRDTADRVFETMANIADGGHATIHDAAVVTRRDDGKITLNNKGFVGTGKGGAIGFGIGLLLGGPLGGAAVGALIGFARSGDRRRLRNALNEKLGMEQSALAVVLEDADWERIKGAIQHFEGEVIESQLTDDAYAALQGLLDDEDVKAVVADEIEEVED